MTVSKRLELEDRDGAGEAMEAMHVAAPAPMDESNAAKENLVQPHEETTYIDGIFEQHEKRRKKETKRMAKQPKKLGKTKAKLSTGKANGVPTTPPSTPATSVNHKARAPESVSPHKRCVGSFKYQARKRTAT